jgi:pyruvate dehydrogenase E2 component (dihydrolipoamide acetyltransferase)
MTAALERSVSGTTVTDRLVRAAAQALVAHPGVNAWFGDDGVTVFEHAHIGIAVATNAGLVVPVIHEADVLELEAIATVRRDVVGRARDGDLGIDDVTGGTFTISNLGMLGIDRFTAIVNVPQVAILAVGATTERFIRIEGEGHWRPMADFTLTCDHRALDGASAAAFLVTLRDAVEAG